LKTLDGFMRRGIISHVNYLQKNNILSSTKPYGGCPVRTSRGVLQMRLSEAFVAIFFKNYGVFAWTRGEGQFFGDFV